MLGVRKYTERYVDRCRERVEADVSAFRDLAARARGNGGMEAFEARFFNDMVLVLDHLFVHRLRTVEGNLLEGAVLVIAVLFAFLGNFRAGLIVASAIPLST